MNRTKIGGILLGLAVVLAVIGMALWASESSSVADTNDQNAFNAAYAADRGVSYPITETSADRSPSLVLFFAAGAGGIFGMLLVAVPGRDEAPAPTSEED